VDWWEGVVALSLRNEAGEVVRRTSVRLADLSAPEPTR
jgi:alkaline phosphatase D